MQLLHSKNLTSLPLTGRYIARHMEQRVSEVAAAAYGLPDVPISVVIRSRNNANKLRQLLEDIQQQDYSAPVELIVVDTESSDGTPKIAGEYGAKVINITQADFTYPKALNIGFEACSHDWVFTFVDHCSLSNDQIFKIATYAAAMKKVGGVAGFTYACAKRTWTESIGTALYFSPRVRKQTSVKPIKKFMGILAANASVINRSAWQAVGGFDEYYAAGGEDVALARSLIEAGYTVFEEQALAVYHNHNVNFIQALRQVKYWHSISKPLPFDQSRLQKYRKDIQ